MGHTRPGPGELRSALYDVSSVSPPAQKLLICAAPRSSSKRLARLLLAAGLGAPMEYFNEISFGALSGRWEIGRRDYLTQLYARRTANGVFTTNLQHHQLAVWPDPRQIDDLFAGATVVHLVRRDKAAQAASLAACWLTGNFGFDEPASVEQYSPRAMKRAAKKAMAVITVEDEQWPRWFERYRANPVGITADEVNRSDLTVVADLAERLDVVFDRGSAERMLLLDSGPYRGYDTLKSRLREYLPS